MNSKQSTTAVLLSRWYSGLQEDDDIRWRQQIIVIDACRLLCVVVEEKFFMDQHFYSKTSMSRAIPSPPLLLTRINAWFTAHAIKHIILGHLKTDRARSNSRMNFKRRTVTESRHSRQSYPQKRILCTEIPIPRRWMTMSWEIWRWTKVICGNPASRPRRAHSPDGYDGEALDQSWIKVLDGDVGRLVRETDRHWCVHRHFLFCLIKVSTNTQRSIDSSWLNFHIFCENAYFLPKFIVDSMTKIFYGLHNQLRLWLFIERINWRRHDRIVV